MLSTNPPLFADRVYSPGGRLVKANAPLSPVCSVRTVRTSTVPPVAVTVALRTGRPRSADTTTPLMAEPPSWLAASHRGSPARPQMRTRKQRLRESRCSSSLSSAFLHAGAKSSSLPIVLVVPTFALRATVGKRDRCRRCPVSCQPVRYLTPCMAIWTYLALAPVASAQIHQHGGAATGPGWQVALDAQAFVSANLQVRKFTDFYQVESPNWFMAETRRGTGPHRLAFTLMASLEPFTLRRLGS